MAEDMALAAAIGVAVHRDKHPLGLIADGTGNAATVPAASGNPPAEHSMACG